MDNSSVKNPFDEITTEDVYIEAISQGCIQRFCEDLTSCIKNANSYIALMKAAKHNVLGYHFASQPIIDVESKKKRLREVASLAREFDANVSEIFAATLEIECKPIAERIIKNLSRSKQENAVRVSSPKKRILKDSEGAIRKSPKIARNIPDDSNESVSSVHTSELSSFSDEIEVPSNSDNKYKRLSFKSVNQAYKSMVEKKNNPTTKRNQVKSRSSKKRIPSESNGSDEIHREKTMPKRKRKPNSRYAVE